MPTKDHYEDPTIEWFLELDGTIHFVDERCKYRVKTDFYEAVDRTLNELGVKR